MKKDAFLQRLSDILLGLPEEERKKSLEYYGEVIDDRMEDGMSEEDAVAAMGAPEAIAAQILRDAGIEPDPSLVPPDAEESARQKTRLYTVLIALVVLAAVWRFGLADWVAGEYQESNALIHENFSGISADMSSFELEFLPADDGVPFVSYDHDRLNTCDISVKNGILRLEEKHALSWLRIFLNNTDREYSVRVFLPAAQYSVLEANTSSGSVSVHSGLSFETAAISTVSGGATFYAAAETVALATTSGQIRAASFDPASFTASSTSGSILLEDIAATDRLEADTTSGQLYFKSLRASRLSASSTSGNVSLSDVEVAALLSAKSTSGNVSLDRCTASDIRVQCSSGKATLSSTQAAESLTVKCVSGDVTLADCEAGAITADASSGTVKMDETRAARALSASTSSGKVALRKCDAPDIQLKSASGKITANLLSPKQFTVSSTSGRVNFPASAGSETCTAHSTSGSIDISVASN